MRVALALSLLLTASTAAASQPEYTYGRRGGAARVEIAPWLALGTGVRTASEGADRALGTVAMDVGVTLPIVKILRIGAWAAPGTTNFSSFDAAGGARIELQTNDFNSEDSELFGVAGRYSFILDVGGGHRFGRDDNRGAFYAVRLAAGFTAPNLLYSLYGKLPDHCAVSTDGQEEPTVCRPSAGIVAGARPFVLFHRAFDGSRTEVTAGIEFEVIGASWWLLGGR